MRWSASASSASPRWRSSRRRLLGGMYWKGGTRAGALAGLSAGFALWAYTLMLPSIAKSGWWPDAFLHHGPFGIELLKPEQFLGLAGLDSLTHSLFWSLLANAGLYFAVSLWRAPSAREASQALLFVDVFERSAAHATGRGPVFWRGRAKVADLLALAEPLPRAEPGAARVRRLRAARGVARIEQIPARRAPGAFRRDAARRRDRQRVGAGDGRLGGRGGAARARRRDAHPRRGLAAARLFACAGGEVALAREGDGRAARRQRAAEEPRPAEGRLHVLGHARAAHAADLDPRPLRADARRPRDGRRRSASSSSPSSSPRPSA